MLVYKCSYAFFFFFTYIAADVTFWYHHIVQLVSSVRQRKDELEQRMSTLQESRRELMVQLEQLMMLLKVPQTGLSSLWLHSAQIQSAVRMPSWLLNAHILFPVGNGEAVSSLDRIRSVAAVCCIHSFTLCLYQRDHWGDALIHK